MAAVVPSCLLRPRVSSIRTPLWRKKVSHESSQSSSSRVLYAHLGCGIAQRRITISCNLLLRVSLEGSDNCGSRLWYSERWSSGWRQSSQCWSTKNDLVAKDGVEDDDDLQGVHDDKPPVPDPKPDWAILERWNVPWDGTTTGVGMLSWLFSFLLTGLAVSYAAARLGIGRRQVLDLDEQATFILIHQLAQTVAGLGSLYFVVSRYKPFPSQLFSYDFRAPFDWRRGWLRYGALGIAGATASVSVASSVIVQLSGHPPPREEADALLQLMPIIGASPARNVDRKIVVDFVDYFGVCTASLIVVTGVLAPLLEETVFRGFLLTSLTKWVPTPVAIVLSAFAFAAAHLTPGEFPQLAALGIVLGLAYAQTRTLITPMLIHSLWNSGVVIMLTILRLQGYDIKELL